jgi:hypothetical protein
MLTDNQTKIIDNIKAEFEKMNKPPKTSVNRLIDKGEFDAKVSLLNKRKTELDMLTIEVTKIAKKRVFDDLKRLNDDLEDMGLVADADFSYGDMKIKITKPSYKYLEICLQYMMYTKYEKLSDDSHHSYRDGVDSLHATFQLNGNSRSIHVNNIEKICIDRDFKLALMNLYKAEYCK